ncbi:alpha,alpha-trehalose-phosphate synthase (UDP-forming) [Rhodopila sp.]|jgi:trehalose 6-phosphate synthase|uniref:alpha,alpha-trehalose-phosphate synthase (UDP-forming) n=1 Tax=Rhodopila sp. TaxID=2480087 RepID=UPI002C8096A8|nr:trehalose-6-phosphate synthase [Rhodopila sp.]HVZ06978.1 trehalose-6-phosphate synthase [Rhodopila sp.]
MTRLVVVSNRVPLPSERGAKAGGLAVALADALRPGSLWFGWSGRRTSHDTRRTHVQRSDGITYATIDLTDAEYDGFYVNFSNGALWPLLHFRLGLLDFNADDYKEYCSVNRRYAAALKALLQPDDVIWVHDYHLIPLGAELRALGVENRIGFFLHTPFVPPAVFQALPRATELLTALCAYDIVGFHTPTYCKAFLDCVTECLGIRTGTDGRFSFRSRTVQAIADPIGIDAKSFAAKAEAVARGKDAAALRESLNGRALAIGVDRLDYSKGLPNRFIAIGRLLANHPEDRRQISFLQIAARSREEQHAYQRLRRELDRIAGETNGRYSEFDWTPLRYMTNAVKRDTLAGFFRIARMAVVTPLRDGMNLVAKEYVAAQDPEDPGVLILSRFAGAAEEMTAALLVNPFDADEIAEAMHRALTMSLQERVERWKTLYGVVATNTAERFCNVFMSYLARSDTVAQRPVLLRAI